MPEMLPIIHDDDSGDEHRSRATVPLRRGDTLEMVAENMHCDPSSIRVNGRKPWTFYRYLYGDIITIDTADGENDGSDTAKSEVHMTTQEALTPPKSQAKPSNPKDAFGVKKAGVMSYVPQTVIAELAIAMAEGAMKYGAHNYLVIGVKATVYTDAAYRHLAQFTNGEDHDTESGTMLSHVTKAIASLTVLRAAMIHGSWVDDRPPHAPWGWMQKVNDKMDDLATNFPDPVARYLDGDKRGPGRILESES